MYLCVMLSAAGAPEGGEQLTFTAGSAPAMFSTTLGSPASVLSGRVRQISRHGGAAHYVELPERLTDIATSLSAEPEPPWRRTAFSCLIHNTDEDRGFSPTLSSGRFQVDSATTSAYFSAGVI